MKAVCAKHGRAYEVVAGCDYCEPAATSKEGNFEIAPHIQSQMDWLLKRIYSDGFDMDCGDE